MASVHNLDDDGGEVFKDRQTALVAGGSVFVNLAALLVVKINSVAVIEYNGENYYISSSSMVDRPCI